MTVVWMTVFTVLVWSAYRTLATNRHPALNVPTPAEGALNVARSRLMHGEISADEYDRIANILRS
ncbi:MAG: hypothetical protein Q8K89_09225 [Actinomycetota bacterium]|nr:hypothetical protein [Coriobacteriia bacterium]MDP2233804.1 hypothetical protein [Actinomycetota bacterium]